MSQRRSVGSCGWNRKQFILHRYGGCDDAKSETSFEAEASCQGRGAGFGRCRFDFWAGGKRLRISNADRRRAAKAQLRPDTGRHARRRGNCRRQPRDIPSLRQGKQWQRPAADGVGLPLRRLWLPRLRLPLRRMRLPLCRRLRLRRRLRRRRLLRNLGFLPLLLSLPQSSDCKSTCERLIGRVRDRPGQLSFARHLHTIRFRQNTACCRQACVLPTRLRKLRACKPNAVSSREACGARRVPEAIGETCVLTQ